MKNKQTKILSSQIMQKRVKVQIRSAGGTLPTHDQGKSYGLCTQYYLEEYQREQEETLLLSKLKSGEIRIILRSEFY